MSLRSRWRRLEKLWPSRRLSLSTPVMVRGPPQAVVRCLCGPCRPGSPTVIDASRACALLNRRFWASHVGGSPDRRPEVQPETSCTEALADDEARPQTSAVPSTSDAMMLLRRAEASTSVATTARDCGVAGRVQADGPHPEGRVPSVSRGRGNGCRGNVCERAPMVTGRLRPCDATPLRRRGCVRIGLLEARDEPGECVVGESLAGARKVERGRPFRRGDLAGRWESRRRGAPVAAVDHGVL